MTTFNDREQAFEAHFALDQEQEFKAQARRDRQLALWAGERMGLKDEPLQNYVLEVMRADLREAGDDDVFQKVMGDLTTNKVACPPEELRAKMDALLQAARTELKTKG